MSQDSETNRSSAAEAAAEAVAAPLDLLLTDAAIGALRRANPGPSAMTCERRSPPPRRQSVACALATPT